VPIPAPNRSPRESALAMPEDALALLASSLASHQHLLAFRTSNPDSSRRPSRLGRPRRYRHSLRLGDDHRHSIRWVAADSTCLAAADTDIALVADRSDRSIGREEVRRSIAPLVHLVAEPGYRNSTVEEAPAMGSRRYPDEPGEAVECREGDRPWPSSSLPGFLLGGKGDGFDDDQEDGMKLLARGRLEIKYMYGDTVVTRKRWRRGYNSW